MNAKTWFIGSVLISSAFIGVATYHAKKEVHAETHHSELKFVIVEEKGKRCKVYIDPSPYDNIPNHPKVCERITKF